MSKPATHILTRVTAREPGALDELVAVVYDELRRIAHGVIGRRPAGQSLQPTELVHEAYLRLVDHDLTDWKDRAHFMATAARAMRHILIDRHRRRGADKRGGNQQSVRLSAAQVGEPEQHVDLVALDEALTRLAGLDERQGRIAEMRIFAGLEIKEIAEAIGVSRRTLQYEWRHARAWLKKTLTG